MATTINPNAGVTTNSGTVYDGIQSGTAIAASGTEVNITGIPSWAKRITLMVSDLSTNGTAGVHVRVGTSSGIVSTGYTSAHGTITGTNLTDVNTNTIYFYFIDNNAATDLMYGTITLYNISGNTWVAYSNSTTSSVRARIATGSVTLSGTLDRIQLFNDGIVAFDAGIVNIFYE